MLNRPQFVSRTHPLPRGGTDLTGTDSCSKGQAPKLHQYPVVSYSKSKVG